MPRSHDKRAVVVLAFALICVGRAAAAPAPKVVVAHQRGVYGLAVDATRVYWRTHDGSVMSAPRHGGPARRLAAAQYGYGPLASSRGEVFFTRVDGRISSVKSGAAVRKLIADDADDALAVIGDNVWYTKADGKHRALVRVPRRGGAPVVAATLSSSIEAFVHDERELVLATVDSLEAFTLPDGPSRTIAKVRCSTLALDAVAIYCGSEGKGAHLARFARADGAERAITTEAPAQLAAARGVVYFIPRDRDEQPLMRIAADGGAPQPVLARLGSADEIITDLVSDGEALYWVEGGPCSSDESRGTTTCGRGAVWRLALE